MRSVSGWKSRTLTEVDRVTGSLAIAPHLPAPAALRRPPPIAYLDIRQFKPYHRMNCRMTRYNTRRACAETFGMVDRGNRRGSCGLQGGWSRGEHRVGSGDPRRGVPRRQL